MKMVGKKLSLQNMIRKHQGKRPIYRSVKGDKKEFEKFRTWLNTLDQEEEHIEKIEDFFDEEAIEVNFDS